MFFMKCFDQPGPIGRGKDCNSGRSNGCEWSQKGLHLSPKLLKTVALMAEIHREEGILSSTRVRYPENVKNAAFELPLNRRKRLSVYK